jgi:hypothetical protein
VVDPVHVALLGGGFRSVDQIVKTDRHVALPHFSQSEEDNLPLHSEYIPSILCEYRANHIHSRTFWRRFYARRPFWCIPFRKL